MQQILVQKKQKIRKSGNNKSGNADTRQTGLTNQLFCVTNLTCARVCFTLFMTKAQRQAQIQRPKQ